MNRNRVIGYTPTGANRRMFLAGCAALVASTGTFVLGRTTAPEPSVVGTPGGLPLRHGVPVPDRRSIAGAATAAQNFQIAGFRTSMGTLDPGRAAEVLLSHRADEQARQVLASPDPGMSARTAYAPVSTVVLTYSLEQAEMLVWGVAATSAADGEPKGIESWGRATVGLVWEGEQWRVLSQRFEPGPWPARADARFAEPAGDFAFRVGELRQSGWSYVPEP